MNPSRNTILITGGGSGIGRALAQRLHNLENHVIVAGRRREALDQTIGERRNMTAIVLDITDAESIAAAARTIAADHPALNVLINNAGIMTVEDIAAKRDLVDAEAMITTNLLGPIRLTNAVLGHLRDKSDAVIVNVTSGLAFVPLVSTPTYSATKAALHSYTVSLRQKLHGAIEVIEIVPPGVRTDLTPGQSTRAVFMPLDDYIDEVMTLLQQQPTPPEILVERVKPLRNAEAEGRFDQMLTMMSRPADWKGGVPIRR